jgi:hypothetical protein
MPAVKQKPMFNSVILLVLSWVVAIGGGAAGAYLFIFYAKDPVMALKGLALFLGCLVVAAVIRMLANMGQLLFDNKIMAQEFSGRVPRDMARLLDANGRLLYELHELVEETKSLRSLVAEESKSLRSLVAEESKSLRKLVAEETKSLGDIGEQTKHGCEKIGCDTKELNTNMHYLKGFFSEIEKHLEMKK